MFPDATQDAADASSPGNEPAITLLLQRAAGGDRAALDAIYQSLYPELKRVARARLRHQGRGNEMGTTMLVHESFVRLVNALSLIHI